MPNYEITSDLAPYVDRYKWEQYLTDAQRHQLACYRAVAAEDEALEDAFFIEYQENHEGWEFLDALGEAGDDPVARAEAFYYLHLDSYPFWIGDATEPGRDEVEQRV